MKTGQTVYFPEGRRVHIICRVIDEEKLVAVSYCGHAVKGNRVTKAKKNDICKTCLKNMKFYRVTEDLQRFELCILR